MIDGELGGVMTESWLPVIIELPALPAGFEEYEGVLQVAGSLEIGLHAATLYVPAGQQAELRAGVEEWAEARLKRLQEPADGREKDKWATVEVNGVSVLQSCARHVELPEL